MGHNARIRNNITEWGDLNRPVTPGEMNQIDQNLAQSINGDLGGTWAPQTPVIIGGTGLRMDGTLSAFGSVLLEGDEVNLSADVVRFLGVTPTFDSGLHVTAGTTTLDGDATLNGAIACWSDMIVHSGGVFHALGDVQLGDGAARDVTILGTLTVEAEATFNNSVTFGSTATFADDVEFAVGTTVTMRGDVRVGTGAGDDITIDGTADFRAPATFDDAVTINADAECWADFIVHSGGDFHALGDVQLGTDSTQAIDLMGTVALHHTLTFADSGRVPRRAILGSATSTTYSITDANEIHVPAGTIGGNIAYGILDTNAKPGDEMVISTADAAHTVGVRTASAGCTMKALDVFTPGFCKLVWIGGAWRLTELVSGT